jgi:hypothetical protein
MHPEFAVLAALLCRARTTGLHPTSGLALHAQRSTTFRLRIASAACWTALQQLTKGTTGITVSSDKLQDTGVGNVFLAMGFAILACTSVPSSSYPKHTQQCSAA